MSKKISGVRLDAWFRTVLVYRGSDRRVYEGLSYLRFAQARERFLRAGMRESTLPIAGATWLSLPGGAGATAREACRG